MPLSWKDRNICLTFHAGKLSQGDFMRLGTAGLVFLLDCSSFCCNFLLFFFFFNGIRANVAVLSHREYDSVQGVSLGGRTDMGSTPLWWVPSLLVNSSYLWTF